MAEQKQMQPVVMRSCDVARCRRVRLLGFGVATVGIVLTIVSGHQAVLAVALLGLAFLAQAVVC